MAHMLLINPRRRKRAASKRGKTAARRVVRSRRKRPAFAAVNAPKRRRRRSRKVARRSNPIPRSKVYRRRRRNPSARAMLSGVLPMLKSAAIGGAGSLAVDYAFGMVRGYLPAALQPVPGTVGAGDGVKALFTVAVGRLLDRPTRGLASKAAAGALTVQARGILQALLPASVTAGLGYASPAMTVPGTNRIGPVLSRVGAYTPGRAPMLSAYTAGPNVVSLNRAGSASGVRLREGWGR